MVRGHADTGEEPRVPLGQVVAAAAGAGLGTVAALAVLPRWAPGMAHSLLGAEGQGYWYLARVTGLVAYGLLWLSTAFGLLLSGRIARVWPGGPAAVDLHRFSSLLALGFALVHTLILLGDRSAGYTLFRLLVPFAGIPYRPLWVGLGQVSLYLLVLILLSSYLRRRIGPRTWRLVHSLTFALYWLVVLHGVLAGTDTTHPAVFVFYLATAGSIHGLTLYRVLVRARPAPSGR